MISGAEGQEQEKPNLDSFYSQLLLIKHQCLVSKEKHLGLIQEFLRKFDLLHISEIPQYYLCSLEIQLLVQKASKYYYHVNGTLVILIHALTSLTDKDEFQKHSPALTVLFNEEAAKSLIKLAKKKAKVAKLITEAKANNAENQIILEAAKLDSTPHTILINCTQNAIQMNLKLIKTLESASSVDELVLQKPIHERFLYTCYETLFMAQDALDCFSQHQLSLVELKRILKTLPRQEPVYSDSTSLSESNSLDDNSTDQTLSVAEQILSINLNDISIIDESMADNSESQSPAILNQFHMSATAMEQLPPVTQPTNNTNKERNTPK